MPDRFRPPVQPQFRFAQRELLVVLLLSAACVAGFFATRAVAAWDERLNRAAAEASFASGQRALTAGEPDAAAEAFRSALARDPERRVYALALADALVQNGHPDQAVQVLAAQRVQTPEDAEVNLRLGRIAAAGGDIQAAARYYHHAVYGLWPEDQAARAQAARLELVEALLDAGQKSAAAAELLAAGPAIPDGPFDPITAGRLFEAADEHQRARAEYLRALDANPSDPVALAGAGRTAFAQQDYGAARSYFAAARRHGELSPGTATADALAALVLDHDPLAPGLSVRERRRRTRLALEQAARRLEGCAAVGGADEQAALAARAVEIERLLPAFAPAARQGSETDLVEVLELIARNEAVVSAACGPAEGLDQALLLVARKHGVSVP